jgi:hypothetical protein
MASQFEVSLKLMQKQQHLFYLLDKNDSRTGTAAAHAATRAVENYRYDEKEPCESEEESGSGSGSESESEEDAVSKVRLDREEELIINPSYSLQD